MPTNIVVPQIGFSMSEGTVVEWHAADGSTVTEGQALFSLESDKSVTDVESPATGILRIKSKLGESYKVGHVLATILNVE
jgi:pyruvate/2-oxoglutarate dehydrogenase complex dihydrolipoamide acyltransferase (E2) component